MECQHIIRSCTRVHFGVPVRATNESVREGSLPCIKPDRVSPLFYLNSSLHPGNAKQNVLAEFALSERRTKITRDNHATELLGNASNVAIFRPASRLQEGTGLLFEYPIAVEGSLDEGEDEVPDDENSGKAMKSRRT